MRLRRYHRTAAIAGAVLSAALALPTVGVSQSASAAPEASSATSDPVTSVDPLIGSTNLGNTFPGATRPYGMMSWSPTTTNGDQTSTPAAGGYSYDNPRVRGFAMTHVNGAGCSVGAQGDLPVMPVSTDVDTSPTADTKDAKYATDFSHSDEKAVAGRYTVTLADGITADLSATDRAGVGTFTFPAGKPANLLFRTSNSFNGSEDADIRIDKKNGTVSGSVLTGAFCGRRANGGTNNRVSYYRLYFRATFDTKFTSQGTWRNDTVSPGSSHTTGGEGYATGSDRAGKGSGGWVGFDTSTTRTVTMRVGLSYTSQQAADANLAAEVKPTDTVDSVATAAQAAWRTRLNSAAVTGGTAAQRTTYYTAMYHAFQQPNVMSDVAGTYLGADRKVHRLARGQQAQYSNFSGWDQYRAQTQLLALLDPTVAGDFAQSLTNLAAQNNGIWDRWVLANAGTHVMTGDPPAPTLAGIYALGVRNFDYKGAFTSLLKQATVPNADSTNDAGCPGQCTGQRPGLEQYLKRHYAAQDDCHCWGGAAETLENSAADYALADWAQRLGKTGAHATMITRAGWWRNTFNPSAAINGGYQQAHNADGTWQWPFSRGSDSGFAQGTSSTYTWMVPQDVSGLAAALGGDTAAITRLDAFFRNDDGSLATGGGQKYDPTNEPGIHTPWLYNALGQPWKTQQTVRAYADKVYGTGTGGLPGNDDLGTMSAWYVFAALGIYPQNPSRGEMLLSSPMFPKAVIDRGNGRRITISAPNASADNIYLQGGRITDGSPRGMSRPQVKSWLPESFINSGGRIDLVLGSSPNTTWGTQSWARPVDHVPAAAQPVPNLPGACTPVQNSCAVDLSTQADVDAVSTDDAPQQGDIDGKGWSIPAQAIGASGPRTIDGTRFLVPSTSGTTKNAVSLRGQRIYLPRHTYTGVDLLVTAVNGDQQVPFQIVYADGSTTTVDRGITDWASSAKYGEETAFTADHRNRTTGTGDTRSVHIWKVSLPVTSAKKVVAITSPNQQNVKVFAVTGRTG